MLDCVHPTAGLAINPDRPDARLPYRGAWLWVGPDMVHLMELPNPDPMEGRPEVGGRGEISGGGEGEGGRCIQGGRGGEEDREELGRRCGGAWVECLQSRHPIPSNTWSPPPCYLVCTARRAGPSFLHRGREHRAAGRAPRGGGGAVHDEQVGPTSGVLPGPW